MFIIHRCKNTKLIILEWLLICDDHVVSYVYHSFCALDISTNFINELSNHPFLPLDSGVNLSYYDYL